MQVAKDYLREKGVRPFISFKNNPKHTVTLKNAKKDQLKDQGGEVIDGMSFLVDESGEEKKFFTQSTSLIGQLAEFEFGDTVTIEMKRRNVSGSVKSYYVVTSSKKVVPVKDEEAPEEPDAAVDSYEDQY